MEFRPYMHVGRLIDDPETAGMLENSLIFIVQPKIDGCNGVIWWDSERQTMRMGNRNKEITMYDINEDTPHNIVSFHSYVCNHKDLWKLAQEIFPDCYIYGEWLVKNHIDYYAPSAWNKFYIFDIWDPEQNAYIDFDNAKEKMKMKAPDLKVDWIERETVMFIDDGVPSEAALKYEFSKILNEYNKKGYLMNPGEQKAGEGIVIKCYDWRNSRGEQKWAKLRTGEYMKKVYTPKVLKEKESIEDEIARKYLSQWDIDKVVAKIRHSEGFTEWDRKYISKLLTMLWYDFLEDYVPVLTSTYKHRPIIFDKLQKAVTARAKYLRSDLF